MSDLGNKKIFAANLQRFMDEKGIDRNRLCDDLGFKYSTVSEWIAGNMYPRIDKIEMMANYFGVQKSALIEEKQISKFEMTLTPHEIEVITAYRAQPEMQIAVDRTLGITSAEGFSLPEENLA